MILVYCELCGMRIAQNDLEQGRAKQLAENQWNCPSCLSKQAAAPVPPPVADAAADALSRPKSDAVRKPSATGLVPVPARGSERAEKSEPAAGRVKTGENAAPAAHKKPLPIPLLVCGVAGVVILGAFVAAFAIMGGKANNSAASAPANGAPSAAQPSTAQPVEHRAAAAADAGTPNSITGASPQTASGTAAPAAPSAPSAPGASATPPVSAMPGAGPASGVEDAMEKMRGDRAAGLLAEAQAFAEQNPHNLQGRRKRLEEIADRYRSTPAGEEAGKLLAALPPEAPPPELEPERFGGRPNLLKYVDLKLDTSGVWQRNAEGHYSPPANGRGKLKLQYELPAEYDVKMVFSRPKPDSSWGLVLAKAGEPGGFLMVLDTQSGKALGLSQIRGVAADKNSSTRPLPGKGLVNGDHSLIVQVRQQGVFVYIDGKPMTQHTGGYGELSISPDWNISGTRALGLFSDGTSAQIKSVQVADVSGTGTLLREAQAVAAAEPGPEPGKPAAAAADAAAPATAPVAPANAAKAQPEAAAGFPLAPSPQSKLEHGLQAAYAQALQDGGASATAKLDALAADPALSAFKPALARDRQLLAAAGRLNAQALAGAALLADKRSYTLLKQDGKKIVTGQGAGLLVKGVKGENLLLEQRVGNGSVETSVALDALALGTRVGLAALAATGKPEPLLDLAACAVMAEFAGETVADLEAGAALKAAERAKAPAELLEHLAARRDALKKEQAARAAFEALEKKAAGGKPAEAREQLTAFLEQHADSAVIAAQQDKLKAMAEKLKKPVFLPGLWLSYWSGDENDRFRKLHHAEASTKLVHNFGNNSPRKGMPGDQFGVLIGGLVSIPADGGYFFEAKADDRITVWIDGKMLAGKAQSNAVNGTVQLTKGEHVLYVEYYEGHGGAQFSLRWRPPGEQNLNDIPAEVLFHQEEKKEAYQQRQK